MQYARGAKFGTFYGPGGKEQAYLGVVKGPILLRFSADMVVYLRDLKVIQHTKPLVLIGADVLSAGMQAGAPARLVWGWMGRG